MRHMLKTITVATVFATGASAALAGGMPEPTCAPALVDGFYLGAGIGATSEIFRTTVTRTANNVVTTTSKDDLGMAGVDGTFYLGYSQNINPQFNLAGEGFFQVRDITGTFTKALPAVSSTYKNQYTYGLAIMPGYNFNTNSRGYIRGGVLWGNNKFNPSTTAVSAAGGAKSKYSKTLFGWELGAGLQAAVCKNWSVRAEYDYVSWSNWKLSSTGTAGTFNTKFSNYENQFMASVQYSLADLV